MEHPDLERMLDYEDACYQEQEERLICANCGGEMDSCTLGGETYYRCLECGLGEVDYEVRTGLGA